MFRALETSLVLVAIVLATTVAAQTHLIENAQVMAPEKTPEDSTLTLYDGTQIPVPPPFKIQKHEQAATLSKDDIKKLCRFLNMQTAAVGYPYPAGPTLTAAELKAYQPDSQRPGYSFTIIRVPVAGLRKNLYDNYRNLTGSFATPTRTHFEAWREAADLKTGAKFIQSHPDSSFVVGDRRELPPASSQYGLAAVYGSPQAGKTLVKMTSEMNPEADNVDMNNLREVFSDSTNIQVMARAALLIDEKISKAGRGEKVYGNVFNDVLSAAQSLIKDDKKAKDLAWKIMAIYGTRGANMGFLNFRLQEVNSRQKIGIAAMQAIALGLSVLDQYAEDQGQHLYSLPDNVKMSCAFGQPYHFWLAAYMARKYAKDPNPQTLLRAMGQWVSSPAKEIKDIAEAPSPSNSALATHLSLLGYNFMSNTSARDPSRAFTESEFSDYNNAVRLTIAVGDAGAYYGAYQADFKTPKTLNIDEAALEMFKHSSPRSKTLSQEEYESSFKKTSQQALMFLQWRNFMGSDRAFQFYKK